MANENANPNQPTDAASQEQTSSVDKQEHMIPKSRLDEVLSQKRALEAKVQEYATKEQEKADADKSWQDRHTTLKTEFDTFKKSVAREKLVDTATAKLKEAGFNEKLIKVGLQADLTEANLDDAVKNFTKEFKEFLPTPVEPKAVQVSLPATASQHTAAPIAADPNKGLSPTEKAAKHTLSNK